MWLCPAKGFRHNGMANFKPCESDFMKVFRPEMEDLPQIMGNMILMVLNHVGWNGHLWQRLSTRRVWRCCFWEKKHWIVRGLMWATSQPGGDPHPIGQVAEQHLQRDKSWRPGHRPCLHWSTWPSNPERPADIGRMKHALKKSSTKGHLVPKKWVLEIKWQDLKL